MAEPKYTLDSKDYLDLWKQFQEDADKAKDKLWTITSWLYALMGGLMVFLLDRQNPDKILILFGAGTGVLLSLYTWYMSKELGRHIKKHWDRANRIKDEKIEGLTEVWDGKNKAEETGSSENTNKEKNTIRKSLLKALRYLTNPISTMRDRFIRNVAPFAQRLMLLAIGYGLAFVLLALYLMLLPPPQKNHHERTTSCTQRIHPPK